MIRDERTHYEIVYYNGKEIVVEKKYYYEDVEIRLWQLRKTNKFLKVFEIKDIYVNGKCVGVEIKEEEV